MSYSNPVGGAGPASTPFATPVAGTKLRIRRSAVLNKVPTATDTEFGELIVNYNAGSAALYTRGSDDSLQQLGGVYISNSAPASPAEKQWWWDANNQILKLRSVGTWIEVSKPFDITAASIGDLSDVDLSGISDGDLLQWNGSEFVAVTPSSISVDVDLGYTPAADKGTVTNTAGDDATIPLATGTNAGLTLNNYTTAEKNKLGGIEDGANVNVNADWNASSGDAQILNKPTLFSGDYDDLTNKPDIPDELSDLSDVDTSGATSGQLLRYNGASWEPGSPAAVNVDLGYTAAADKGTVTNDSGDDAEIPLANGTNAGLMSPADKTKLDNATASDLQGVTDAGNTTTNEIVVDGLNIGSGPGTGTGNMRVGEDALAGNTTGGNNFALGFKALESNTEGNYNIAIGASALAGNNTGSSNVGIGGTSLRFNTGISNTAVGVSALRSNTSGNNNTCIGLDAGFHLTDGDNNTIIGSLKGSAGMANTMLFGAGKIERFRVTDAGALQLGGTPGTSPNISLNADGSFEFAGGVINGSVTTPEQTVTSIAFDLSAGPYWLIPGSFDVPNPTNGVAGMSGLIRFTAAPNSWGSAFQFAGGTPVSPSKLPAVSPFYVQASGSVYVGPAVEELI